MISAIEIYKAIRERLEELFPTILVQQKDIKNITRPSFYIQYVGKNFTQNASEFFEDKFTINIVYFAEKEELLELLEVEETIIQNFYEPLEITDNNQKITVEIENIKTNLEEEDYYLNTVVDFTLSQHLVKSDIDNYDIDILGEIRQKEV